MKKRLFVIIVLVMLFVSLMSCGLAGKIKTKTKTIEVGTVFNENEIFECKDGVTIKLKDGEQIDTSKIGEAVAVFVISDGEKTEEKEFKFKVVDTQPPQIETNNITVYVGKEFDPIQNVSCVDNSGEDITVTVLSNNVEADKPGEYEVVYEAKDSSGNADKKTITISVISIETAEDVMDLIDEYISTNELSKFEYYKSDYPYDDVCVKAPSLSTYSLNSDRVFHIRPRIFVICDVFTGDYYVDKLIFDMDLMDSSDINSRFVLSADSFDVIAGDNVIASNLFDGIPPYDSSFTSLLKNDLLQALGAVRNNNN